MGLAMRSLEFRVFSLFGRVSSKLRIIPRAEVRLYGMQLMSQNCAVRRCTDL